MEKTEKNQKAEGRNMLVGLYAGGVFTILNLILREGFSIKNPIAFSVAALIASLFQYPLFIRGTENRWKKGKQWTFLTWLLVFVIPLSVLTFIFVSLGDWLIRG